MRRKIQSVFLCTMLIICSFTLVIPINISASGGGENHCWWSDKGQDLEHTLMPPELDLSNLTSVTLSLWHKYGMTWYDSGRIEVSSDGGTTWNLVKEYTDSISDWDHITLDLSSWAGMVILLRFRYKAAPQLGHPVIGEGWWVDDISIPEIGFFEDAESGIPPGWDVDGWKIVTMEKPSFAEWIPFIPGASPGTLCEVLPKSRDTMGLCVDSNFFGMYKINTVVNKTVYHYLHVPNAGRFAEVGKPAVPAITRYFEIPHNVDISVNILYKEEQILDGYNIIPSQEPLCDIANATIPPFTINSTTYSIPSFFPSNLASIQGEEGDEPIIIRGVRIVALSIYPVQFNPVENEVKVHSKIEVRMNYSMPAQVNPVSDRLKSAAFDNLCEGLILNYKYRTDHTSTTPLTSSSTSSRTLSGSEGAEYLIITHDDFEVQIQPLADWKERKGLLTKVVTTSEINAAGLSADDITDYIRNAYYNWNPAPSYILLVGDSEFIPPHYENEHPSTYHGGFDIPTDLYYVTVHGDDYFPDIYIGRLSVDTAAQTTTIVNKILMYECNPPIAPNFYNSISACAFFEDKDPRNGYEDRRFVLTSEEIRDHLQNIEGYNVGRIYSADRPGDQNPTHYNYGKFNNGDELPVGLLWPGFAWNGNAINIRNALNGGRFLIYHRDHGESCNGFNHDKGAFEVNEGWSDPSYETNEIALLTNGNLLPVVFSVDCQCGWFDGEVDQNNDPALTNNFESFCEEFVRHANGGAVAAFGASRNSQSGYNDELIKGYIDAIWPRFNPDFASGGLYSLGQVNTYGKMYMAQAYTTDYAPILNKNFGTDFKEYLVVLPFVQTTFELFNLFGDPEMEIWTDNPEQMNVKYPDTIGSEGPQTFIVTVKDQDGEPVNFARVCLRKENDIYKVDYTNPGGWVRFDITPSFGGNMDITVTKHNYRPHIADIMVTNDGATLIVDPEAGSQGKTIYLDGDGFELDETVEITFPATPLPVTYQVDAVDGSFRGFDIVIPDGEIGYVNIVAEGQTSGRTAVVLFRRLPDRPLPDPYLYNQYDPSTWHLNPAGDDTIHNPTWNNPCIALYDADGNWVNSKELESNKQYTIKVGIYNDEPESAIGTKVNFAWTGWGVGQGSGTWTPIGDDPVEIDIPAATNTLRGKAIAEIKWKPAKPGHICIRVEIYHDDDLNFDNNMGIENTRVKAVSSPGEVNFLITNNKSERALVYLEARQIDSKPLWPAWIIREYPQELGPNETQMGTFIVDVPGGVNVGEFRTFKITAYIGDEIIGGIEVNVTKDHPPILIFGYNPTTGTAGSVFSFNVIYFDKDNHPPLDGSPLLFLFKGEVQIDNSPFIMNEVDSADLDYTDGKIYSCSVMLTEPGDDYSYYFSARDILGIEAGGTAISLKTLMVSPVDFKIQPESLNLKSKGKWITCNVKTAEDYRASDIIIGTVLLEDYLPADWSNLNGDTAMIKFDRSDFEDMLLPGTYTLKVTGEMMDGTLFECYTNEIKVIEPP
ncbi:MAG: hypothetical protein JSV56_00535 [Methanomassiliicoccales archaeon]|nr:MAG: hypothetical protein JSV56_00535 [Methanomassiliicoccales archaeon]